jgi:hypothetical protein
MDRVAVKTVVLEGVMQIKHPFFGFVWYTRRFTLCADSGFRRYDGDQLRYLIYVSSTTTIDKEKDVEFIITFKPPHVPRDCQFHIRAGSAVARDRWFEVISATIAAETQKERSIEAKFAQPGLSFLEGAAIVRAKMLQYTRSFISIRRVATPTRVLFLHRDAGNSSWRRGPHAR